MWRCWTVNFVWFVIFCQNSVRFFIAHVDGFTGWLFYVLARWIYLQSDDWTLNLDFSFPFFIVITIQSFLQLVVIVSVDMIICVYISFLKLRYLNQAVIFYLHTSIGFFWIYKLKEYGFSIIFCLLLICWSCWLAKLYIFVHIVIICFSLAQWKRKKSAWKLRYFKSFWHFLFRPFL